MYPAYVNLYNTHSYSRKILWLKIADSNNNQALEVTHNTIQVLKFCCWWVHVHSGCPRILRTDYGTENSCFAFLQPLLRHQHNDDFSGNHCHRYGKSTSNQVHWVNWMNNNVWGIWIKHLVFQKVLRPL